MKFGENLKSQIVPEWADHYLDYDLLKSIIKEMEESQLDSEGLTRVLLSHA